MLFCALAAEQLIGTLNSGRHRNLSDAEFRPLAGRLDSLRQAIRAIGADIPGEDFFRALLMVWLGPKVRDPDLRERLLGKEPA